MLFRFIGVLYWFIQFPYFPSVNIGASRDRFHSISNTVSVCVTSCCQLSFTIIDRSLSSTGVMLVHLAYLLIISKHHYIHYQAEFFIAAVKTFYISKSRLILLCKKGYGRGTMYEGAV